MSSDDDQEFGELLPQQELLDFVRRYFTILVLLLILRKFWTLRIVTILSSNIINKRRYVFLIVAIYRKGDGDGQQHFCVALNDC